MSEGIKFVYNEPAMIINTGWSKHLVIGDLHIGIERKLSDKGVHVYSASDAMAGRIRAMMKEFSLKKIIMLGDIKESILYPDAPTSRLIKGFFGQLDDFNITIVAGNHDAHLDEIIDLPITRELVLGRFSLLHGDKNPSEGAMLSDYMITAHSHAIARIKDANGAVYDQKVWLISKLNAVAAHRMYKRVNDQIKLVVMPAFNSLIMGTQMSRFYKESANPLIRNRIFDAGRAEMYNLMGQRIDLKAASRV